MESQQRGAGRPVAATRDHVEQAAFALMMSRGYDAVNLDDIAAAAGIGRTTYFRYFGSKAGVVWASFDENIRRMTESLAAGQPDSVDALREAIRVSTSAEIDLSEVWLERFVLLDTTASLRSGAYDHWERWKRPIAEFVAGRISAKPGDAVPAGVAGACQGVYVAALRDSTRAADGRAGFLARIDAGLVTVLGPLRQLL